MAVDGRCRKMKSEVKKYYKRCYIKYLRLGYYTLE